MGLICVRASIHFDMRSTLMVSALVKAGGIGLPHFNQGIRDRTAIFFQHAAGENDPFTDRLPSPAGIGGQITVARLNGIVAVNRARELRECLG